MSKWYVDGVLLSSRPELILGFILTIKGKKKPGEITMKYNHIIEKMS